MRPGLPITYRTEFQVLNGSTRYLAKLIVKMVQNLSAAEVKAISDVAGS